ncbi:MAG: hypothetical protein MJ244_04635 [Clostridia bacterium]|nr:hypothetical protein [Clostridia bacterium]
MKKMDMSKMFDIIIAICVICAVASFAKEFFANSAYESETGREILSMVDFESYNGSIINECDATAHYMNKLESELSLLPESLVSQYKEDGNIHVVTEIRECVDMPAKFDYIDQISGVYVYSDSNIYMHYNASNTSDVLHEMGHYVDHMNDMLTNSDAFVAIYEAEKDSFQINMEKDSYYVQNSAEFFAESFEEYFENSDSLKAACPETYEFINNLVKNVY